MYCATSCCEVMNQIVELIGVEVLSYCNKNCNFILVEVRVYLYKLSVNVMFILLAVLVFKTLMLCPL